MKTPKPFYLFVAITLLGFIGYATAASNIPSPASPFQYGILSKLAELGITDAQKVEIHAILREAQPGFEPLVKQFIQERRALRNTIHAAPVNEPAIRTQADRVAQFEADLAVKRAHISERVRTVLTPDQITKLKDIATQLDSRVDAMVERIS